MTVEPGVEEAGVEAVACADGVDGVDGEGGGPVALDAVRGALLDEGTTGSALDDDEGDALSERIEGFVERRLDGYFLNFILVRKEQVYVVEECVEDAVPVAGWIVVGVEREGKTGFSELIEEIGESGMETGLKEEGREMEMARGAEVGQIEVGDGHLRHDAGVGEDVSFPAMGEEDGHAGAGAGFTGDVGGVEASFG